MWGVWGLLAAITAAFYVYRSRLTRDEEDQIFLDDSFDHLKAQQMAIVAKVNKVQPVLYTFMGLFAAATLFVIGYYIWDIVNQFK
jgi:membrane protein insertase Oxa1/YidC/SpoIIIJ